MDLDLYDCADFLNAQFLGRRALIRAGSFEASSAVTVTGLRLIEGPTPLFGRPLSPGETVLQIDFYADADASFLGLPPAGWLFFESRFRRGRFDPLAPERLFLESVDGTSSIEPVGVAPRW